jgi:ATP-dependent DNA ligase
MPQPPMPFETMAAKSVEELPRDDGWQFEPKWDGFRCLAVKAGSQVALYAKSGKPLSRYFPEIVEALSAVPQDRFVVDGELVISVNDRVDFGALQMRLHPAESRVRRLAAETPATLILFDCLALGETMWAAQPLSQRRSALEKFFIEAASQRLRLSPFTLDRKTAVGWLGRLGGSLDGVIAKRRNQAYRPGERAMLKVKALRTADCVVGGFRYLAARREVGALLLGLYDRQGRLNHVGFTATITNAERPSLTRRLEALIEPPGFTGDAPGGPSRWSTERSAKWAPLRPVLVVEVRFDHVSDCRFRHGTSLLRWRPDKDPRQCRMDQLEAKAAPARLIAEALAISSSAQESPRASRPRRPASSRRASPPAPPR